ncbi:MAG: FlgO family outer membrane protein [Desulfovibrionaceae bacterium]
MKTLCLLIACICLPTAAQAFSISHAAVTITESLNKQLEQKFYGSSKEFPLLVTTPVDINTLLSSTPLGKQFAQEMATQFVQKGYLLQEARLANSLIFSETEGELILSRSVSLVNPQITIGYLVAGTYAFSMSHIRFSIEIIDAKTSTIVAMASVSIPITEDMKPLLQKTRVSSNSGISSISIPSVFTKIE